MKTRRKSENIKIKKKELRRMRLLVENVSTESACAEQKAIKRSCKK
jgi:hypothetical protein